MEIERKFLVKKENIPVDLNSLSAYGISQGYLNPDDEYLIRVRSSKLFTNSHVSKQSAPITYKMEVKSRGLMAREEFGADISRDTFDEMFSKCKRTIAKIRYIYVDGIIVYEIDEYVTLQEMTVEVEFKTEEAANAFIPPAWLGKEVTYDESYKNVNLAI